MAVIVMALRNLHDARVRSPFDAHPLREPGQALRDRLDRAFAGLFLNGALGPIVTLAPLVYGMGRMLFANRAELAGMGPLRRTQHCCWCCSTASC
jgi:hypothetical protein